MVAVIDWYSRYIVGFSLSNTLETGFIIDTIKKAIKKYGVPEIMNSDQGSQFTSEKYVNLLKENSVTAHKSMALEITKKRLKIMESITSKSAKIEIIELNSAQQKTGTKVTLFLPIQYIS